MFHAILHGTNFAWSSTTSIGNAHKTTILIGKFTEEIFVILTRIPLIPLEYPI